MPWSVLVYRDVPPEMAPSRATVIPLHGYRGNQDSLLGLARALGPDVRTVAPAAARSVYAFRDVVGQTWFGGWSLERPEPASFGDSLAQIERFVYDVIERNGPEAPAPYLLGVGQGAVLALATTGVVPDRVAGVVAVGGCLPVIPGWTPPVADLAGLPILVVADPDATDPPLATVESSVAELRRRGGSVTFELAPAATTLGEPVVALLRDWLVERS